MLLNLNEDELAQMLTPLLLNTETLLKSNQASNILILLEMLTQKIADELLER
jgi:hypothetical protein